ncbi:hypothetical protein HHL23_13570 [Chryseobacterium sp. RP-3-3]|uniref:Uncharacterized protein n=1 Tax=Chryseobacterium antibioticum TaxID=2728847 RepID=A0A7Y0FSM4_9FLAO|nr:hypothetical protein [Chryseobacterium antibioticum]NML70816.1 hypothetical protein [Chryseobacterium antibioticum]
MRKIISIVCFITVHSLVGQVGIGTTSPNASAILDMDVTSITPKKGFLLPRVSLLDRNDNSTIASPATGLLVYSKTTSGIGNDLIKENSMVVWKNNFWESISNLPEIKMLKVPILYVLTSKDQQNFSPAELGAVNSGSPVVISWVAGDVFIDNPDDMQLTGNQVRFLTDSYYQISGAVNFKPMVSTTGNSTKVIIALQSSTDGITWSNLFSNATPVEKNAADKTQSIAFEKFIHHFLANELLRFVIYKPNTANPFAANSGIIVNVPGSDITKTFRIVRIQQ